MGNKELYFSVDVETNGPIPGSNSMLSLGCAAFTLESEKPVSTFAVNLEVLEGSTPYAPTTEFWAKNPEAYAETRRALQQPEEGMTTFNDWVLHLCLDHGAKAVAVGYPITFDFMFMYWYLVKFVGSSPFGFQGLDCKTLGMALLGCGFRDSTKKKFPNRWFGEASHTHIALDDAIEQGVMFVRMMRELKR